MFKRFIFVTCIASLLLNCTVHSSVSRNIDDNYSDILRKHPKLVLLGTSANGKAFFLDNSVARNWFEARDYAASINLKLAEFLTPDESDFIKNIHDTALPKGIGYWTAGADSLSQSQYVWHSTGHIFSALTLPFYNEGVPRTCILIGGDSVNRILHGYPCSNSYYVLLQI